MTDRVDLSDAEIALLSEKLKSWCSTRAALGGHATPLAGMIAKAAKAIDQLRRALAGDSPGEGERNSSAAGAAVEDMVSDAMRHFHREEAAVAAEHAALPEGYQWGDDAMEAFEMGKRQAAKAIRALAQSRTPALAAGLDGREKK